MMGHAEVDGEEKEEGAPEAMLGHPRATKKYAGQRKLWQRV